MKNALNNLRVKEKKKKFVQEKKRLLVEESETKANTKL